MGARPHTLQSPACLEVSGAFEVAPREGKNRHEL